MFPKMKVAQNTNLSFAPIITIRPNTGYGFLLIKLSPIMFNLLTRPNAAKYVAKNNHYLLYANSIIKPSSWGLTWYF